MPCADDAAFKQAEGALDCVSVNVPFDIVTETMVDLAMLVFELTTHRVVIGCKVVGHNELDVVGDVLTTN